MPAKHKWIKYYMIFVIACSVLLLLPLLKLSLHNHPAADDYAYASATYHSWNEGHSVIEVIKEAISGCMQSYNSWQGTYVSCFLFELHPAIFGERYYFITTFVMLLSIWGGNYIILKYLMQKYIKARTIEILSVWTAVSSYMTQFMPSPVQGLYWFNGSIHYVFYYGFLTCLCTILLSLLFDDNATGRLLFKTIAGILLALIVSGGNYLTALIGVIIVVFAVVTAFLMRKYKALTAVLFVAAASITGFLINVLAPGNKVRQSLFEDTGKSPVKAIFSSIREGVLNMDMWFSLSTVLFLLALLPIFLTITDKVKYKLKYRHVLFMLIAFVGIICAMYTPPLYAMGFADDGRILNIIWCVFVILLTILFFCFLSVLRSKIELADMDFPAKIRDKLSDISRFSVILTAIVYFAFVCICMHNSAAYKAFCSIVSGEAYQYDMEANERIKIYLSSEGEDVIVAPFSVKPELLFFDDITDDPNGWQNVSVSGYYNLNSVQLYHR